MHGAGFSRVDGVPGGLDLCYELGERVLSQGHPWKTQLLLYLKPSVRVRFPNHRVSGLSARVLLLAERVPEDRRPPTAYRRTTPSTNDRKLQVYFRGNV